MLEIFRTCIYVCVSESIGNHLGVDIMKFAKLFQQVLNEEHVPEEWINRAIQYKQLKKRINKVVEELENVGISKDDENVTYSLELIGDTVHPILKIRLSPLLRTLILDKINSMGYEYEIKPLKIEELDNTSVCTTINPFDDDNIHYELKISLLQDSKFFQVLYDEIEDLDKFKEERETEITKDVENLANNIGSVAAPKIKKSDMYIWREIFQFYIESEIFFSTVEREAGEINIEVSRERYFKFLQHLHETKIVTKFQQKQSFLAFEKFKQMNFEVMKISNYQTFNNMAVRKILKKFDKQTHLTSKEIFPELIKSHANILNGSIAKDICFIIANRLLTVVPQIDDYLCPICCSIAFKPIRLRCGHLFCIRCLVKLRRKHEDKCPLCREECLLSLTVDDLDIAQMNYMKMFFPKEVREKEVENDKEIIKETYGTTKPCVIM